MEGSLELKREADGTDISYLGVAVRFPSKPPKKGTFETHGCAFFAVCSS